MTDPKYAGSKGGSRYYDIPDLPSMMSVTSIIGVVEKPQLVNWSAKMAAERAVKSEDTWHAIQQEEGDAEAIRWIAQRHRDYTSYRQTLGSAVHYFIETQGDLDDPKLALYLNRGVGLDEVTNHYAQFQRFLDEVKPRVMMQEVTVVNLDHNYAGTLDMTLMIDGKHYVADIKTGGVYDTVKMQLAAYRYATHSVENDGSLAVMDEDICGGVVIELKPKSYKLHYFEAGEDDFEAFLAAKRLRDWQNNGR